VKYILICFFLILTVSGVSGGHSSAQATNGQLVNDIIEIPRNNINIDLVAPLEGQFVVIERIDAISERIKGYPVGYFDPLCQTSDLALYMQKAGKRPYENSLNPKQIVSGGNASGLVIPSGFQLLAQSAQNVNKVIISYRVYSQ
jgi:hypothetical protein|tara:strand:+ start:641 stop:1072 length:432 start_codon:yes stop_codon:yes gene_type:complete